MKKLCFYCDFCYCEKCVMTKKTVDILKDSCKNFKPFTKKGYQENKKFVGVKI